MTFLRSAEFRLFLVSLSCVHVQNFVNSAEFCALMSDHRAFRFRRSRAHVKAILRSLSEFRVLQTFVPSFLIYRFLAFRLPCFHQIFFPCISKFPGFLQTILRSVDSPAFMIRISCVHVPNFVNSSPHVCAIILGQSAFIAGVSCIHHTFLRAYPPLRAFARLFCLNVQSFVLPYTDFFVFVPWLCCGQQIFVRSWSVFRLFMSKSLWVQQTFERSCAIDVSSCS